MVTAGYAQMQAEIRQMNREIAKIAKNNAERHQAERKISHCMYTPKSTMRRIRQKALVR